MISNSNAPNAEIANALSFAHPLIRDWFSSKFSSPTEPQVQGWPSILAKEDSLISAPTGSGKTLAAFLVCIDQLVRQALAGTLKNQTSILYISPLKALTNDVQKNLLVPLKEISALAKARGFSLAAIEVAVRTSDTLARERQAMLKKPPHILVTTPESLYLLLTAEKSRLLLKTIHTVIVDEIHALANNKRGSHLSLSLERLTAITYTKPLRIGLSATQKPIELVGNFLVGNTEQAPRIIDIGHARQLELAIEVPGSELTPVASNELWEEIYNRLTELAQPHRSTLVFVNTRRLAERVTHHLAERLGKDLVAAHHGSLSRKLRLNAEAKLKNGELKILVATASLELGIDIGSIDLVCQIGSPRAISVALQRIGRAGHWHGAVPRGRLFATTRDELLECAALVHAISEGDLDALQIPEKPLDILSQQIVATCATDDWQEDALFALIKRSYPYRKLSRETFNEILAMLSSGIAGTRGRYGCYLFRDQVNGIVKARRGSRLTAITSGGAIPENTLFTVIAEPHGIMVGTLDEDFAIESNRGDIILLGNTSWKIRRVEGSKGRVLVEDAHGAAPTVPFWRGEAPARTQELSLQVGKLREKLHALLPANLSLQEELSRQKDAKGALHWLTTHCGVSQAGAEQIIEYILQGRAVLGDVPSQKTLIAERFFDESGGMQLIIHCPFGARLNKAWGLALRKRFCRSFNFELQAAATDDGIAISLTEQHSFPLADVFNFLHPQTVTKVLTQAILQSPLFTTRWRWDAIRALALPRFRNGRKVPPNILRMLADDLLAAVFPDAAACQDNLAGKDIELPHHPLITETIKDVLTEALDIEALISLLTLIRNHKITCIAVDTPSPSVFAHEILNANPYAFLDDAPLEERRARAVSLRRVLPSSLGELGRLDPIAISEVQQQAWPDIRSPDELHDLLQTLVALPTTISLDPQRKPLPNWQDFFAALANEGRVGKAVINEQEWWLATENKQLFINLYPQAKFQSQLIDMQEATVDREQALRLLLTGWLQHLGPTSAKELAKFLKLEISEIESMLIKLEASGLILRGHFRGTKGEGIEWCERRLLGRIHRLTLGNLRKEIEPVTSGQFVRWLLNWQHLAPGTQLSGERGLLEVISQLQGYESPANAWENQILARRVKDYSKELLDRLCLTGVIGWGRLSPHPAFFAAREEHSYKRILPTSVAPIAFFVRAKAAWMSAPRAILTDNFSSLSHAAQAIYNYLQEKGASFFHDIGEGIGYLNAEVETGLWELVAAGLITADGFDNLRALIDPKRRTGRKGRRARQTSGRWSLLRKEKAKEPEEKNEALAWLFLKRYGVCFRELLAREKIAPSWRELLILFRRLEARGEIRGGRFVDGFIGEQFALPYAAESLRAIKKKPPEQKEFTIFAVDPLNLFGIILPGERVSAISGKQGTFTY